MVVRARNQTSASTHSIDVSWEVPPPMYHREGRAVLPSHYYVIGI